jgi:hypothetical protein
MRVRYSVSASAIATLRSVDSQLIPVAVTEEQDVVAAQPWTVAEKIEIDIADNYARYTLRLGAALIVERGKHVAEATRTPHVEAKFRGGESQGPERSNPDRPSNLRIEKLTRELYHSSSWRLPLSANASSVLRRPYAEGVALQSSGSGLGLSQQCHWRLDSGLQLRVRRPAGWEPQLSV